MCYNEKGIYEKLFLWIILETFCDGIRLILVIGKSPGRCFCNNFRQGERDEQEVFQNDRTAACGYAAGVVSGCLRRQYKRPDANNGDNASTGNNSGTNGSGSTSDDTRYLRVVYTASYQTLTTDEELSSIDRVTYANGKLYMVAWMVTGTQVDYYDENWNLITDEEKIANGEYAQTSEYDKTEPVICSMNIDEQISKYWRIFR